MSLRVVPGCWRAAGSTRAEASRGSHSTPEQVQVPTGRHSPRGPHHTPFLMATSGPGMREGVSGGEDGGREAARAPGPVEAPGDREARPEAPSLVAWG